MVTNPTFCINKTFRNQPLILWACWEKKCQFSQLQIIGIFQWKPTTLSEDVIKNIYKYIDEREYFHIFLSL